MKIIVDAMGGDNAPDAIILGAINAVKELNVDVALVGNGEIILKTLGKLGISDLPEKASIVDATQVIDVNEDPTTAIRTKKNSSIVVGLNMLADGKGDAFVSAGSTGAVLTGATLIVKRVKGIRRAGLAPIIPSKKGRFVLIDCGANSDCTAEYLLQFAYMGSFYCEDVLGIKNPRVGLLNNGAESTKGTYLQIETHKLLENSSLNFVGNVEAKDAMSGACDVLVTDGFSGNVFLKTVEGTASLIMSELKSVFYSNFTTKLSALLIKKKMQGLKDRLDSDKVGATALLGISKPVLKAHGSSSSAAIVSAIKQAVVESKSSVADKLLQNSSMLKIAIDRKQN